MPDPTNIELAAALDELGDLNELDGAIVHRVVAYRNAAKAVREAPGSVAALVREGRATELPGVGKTLDEKLHALIETGSIPAAEKLRAKFPAGLVEMTKLDGLGPKRARRLYDELGIDSLAALGEAAKAGRISELKGFGAKAEQSLLEALAAHEERPASARLVLARAMPVAEAILEGLRAHPAVERAEIAGSARRLADDVKDLDVVVASEDVDAVVAAFAELEVIAAERRRRCRRARPWPRTGCASTCASCRRRRSATCSSTSPAPRRTTCACARWP